MKKYLSQLLNLRKGEYIITFLMFFYSFILLVTYYLLKPARDALFLTDIGPSQLPIVFVLIGIIAIPVNSLYSIASRRYRINQLINYTIIALIICLFILRWLMQFDHPWIPYAFYIWVSIFGALTTSQFWLYANTIFNPSQAKRVFILLSLGAILGAFVGGELERLVEGIAETETFNIGNILFFCIGLLVICMVFVNASWIYKSRENDDLIVRKQGKKTEETKLGDAFSTIKKSRYLLVIVGIIGMTMATSSFVDYQFKAMANAAYSNPKELGAFLGKFYGRMSLACFILQTFFSYRLLKFLGVGGIIRFLPFGLLLGSATMLFMPGLLAGVMLRGTDGTIKYSLDKTGRELLFLPVSQEIKNKIKIFIDVIVDRWFRAVAGGLMILFITILDFSVSQVSIIVIILLAIWISLTFIIKKEYTDAFRKAIEKRDIDPSELRFNVGDPSTIEHLKNLIKSKNDRQVIYGLDMLQSVKDVDISDDVAILLKHDSYDIRLRALKALQKHIHPEFEKEISVLLRDPDPEVRLESIHYLYLNSTRKKGAELLKDILDSDDLLLKASVIRCISMYCPDEEKGLVTNEIIKSIIEDKSEDSDNFKIQLAKAIPGIRNDQFNRYLKEMIDDPSMGVAKAAIVGLGNTLDRDIIPLLFNKLSDRNYRNEARIALSTFSNRALGTLNDYLTDENVELTIRKNIPKILVQIPTQESVKILTSSLSEPEPLLRYSIIKALNKLRVNQADLKFDDEKIDETLLNETQDYYHLLQVLDKYGKDNDSERSSLLNKALTEKLDRKFEKIFRLLGLVYPAKDIFNAYQRIISPSKTLRANAYEFLDNVLMSKSKKHLLPIFETEAPDIAKQHAERAFNLKIKTKEQALTQLIIGPDPWLKACAIFNIEKDCSEKLLNLLKDAKKDKDYIIKESAEKVLAEIGKN
ncbi:MAG: hypothetical protein GY863_03965 [bacterium]|nr:hypothetical protein [bacterium]